MTDKTAPFFKDILRVLQDLGGKAKAAEVTNRVIKKRDITEADYGEFETKTTRGLAAVRKEVRFARYHLVNTGYLRDDSEHGQWELSDKGYADIESVASDEEIQRASYKIIDEKRRNRGVSGQGSDSPDSAGLEEDADDAKSSPSDEEQFQEALLAKLRDMSPYQFEHVCKRLLTEMGLENVNVTPQSRDGGFDGDGYLADNPLVKTKIVFECKRYQKGNSVAVQAVRNVQAVISQNKGEKGVIITTSDFSSDARKEAVKGNSRIELIDGEELTGLFVKYKLGVKERKVMEVDDHFFIQFKDKT